MAIFLVRLFQRFGRIHIRVLLALAAAIMIVGALLFSLTQHLSLGTGLYWSVTTATTVGYGDVTPHDTAGRIIAAAVMLTTIPIVGAVFALLAGAAVLTRIRRLLGMETRLPTTPYTAVYGSHPIIPRVLAELHSVQDPVVLVAQARPTGVPDDIHFLAGDPTDEALIRQSAPAGANRALIACESDADTLVIAVAIHGCAPELEVYALTQSPAVARALTELGVTHTLSSDELVGHTIAKSLETPGAGHLILQLVDSSSYRLVESGVEGELVSQRLSQARGRSGVLVLGIARHGTVDLGVSEDPVLAEGDRLIVLQPAEASA
jgi:voltage-gated potassium channel